jgi:hypothetical protein
MGGLLDSLNFLFTARTVTEELPGIDPDSDFAKPFAAHKAPTVAKVQDLL